MPICSPSLPSAHLLTVSAVKPSVHCRCRLPSLIVQQCHELCRERLQFKSKTRRDTETQSGRQQHKHNTQMSSSACLSEPRFFYMLLRFDNDLILVVSCFCFRELDVDRFRGAGDRQREFGIELGR